MDFRQVWEKITEDNEDLRGYVRQISMINDICFDRFFIQTKSLI